MDITEAILAKVGISSGVTVTLVGRWFLNILRGQFMHLDIRCAPAVVYERQAGWFFHLLIGGGIVALAYPSFFMYAGVFSGDSPLLTGLLFGLATCVLPWFILMPSLGWGLFGWRGPTGLTAILSSLLSHLPYGLGVGAVMALMS